MSGYINLEPLRKAMDNPFAQEMLAQSRARGAIKLMALCDVMLEDPDTTHREAESVFDYRAGLVAKYGEPDPQDILEALAEKIELYACSPPEFWGSQLAAAQRVFARITGIDPEGGGE